MVVRMFFLIVECVWNKISQVCASLLGHWTFSHYFLACNWYTLKYFRKVVNIIYFTFSMVNLTRFTFRRTEAIEQFLKSLFHLPFNFHFTPLNVRLCFLLIKSMYGILQVVGYFHSKNVRICYFISKVWSLKWERKMILCTSKKMLTEGYMWSFSKP
jgi:hypothetical protein